jgi:hypothetical protein
MQRTSRDIDLPRRPCGKGQNDNADIADRTPGRRLPVPAFERFRPGP